MIKVSMIYQAQEGARFDHDYFRNRHMPLVAQRLGSSCDTWEIDRGLEVDSISPPFVAMGHIFSESIGVFMEGFLPHKEELERDVKNYTDLLPLVQFSEVL
ncbi:EthD family reductase [Herbaspirillum frisingense]|uniref:EthD family reductase n=1 Tax=Herbaspirillum frisingense TaxID=92645 RepID=UPI0016003C0B|nr:EthD family reductase [Herbaspirillum frisingense]QNB06735.1 EthD family reductase [Herbaspirillum frisingense]